MNVGRHTSARGAPVDQTTPFIAAQYEGRKVTIRRNPDYQVSSTNAAPSLIQAE